MLGHAQLVRYTFGCCVDSSGSEGAFLGTVNLSGSVFTSCNTSCSVCELVTIY